MRLENRSIVVTGAASFIGLAVARKIVSEGGRVVLGDRNADLADEFNAEFSGNGCYLAGDVTDDSYLEGLLNEAVDRFGGVDGVVNGAAIFDDQVLATSRSEWMRSLDINLISAARLTDLATPHIEARGGGAVVYIASISAYVAQPARMVYPVTKAALVMLAKTAAMQLAPKKIRVNTVSPGWTWSRNIERRYGTRERADALAAEMQTLGRLAEPDEIADAAAFLLSSEASFITGTDLAVDGGYSSLGPEALGQAFEKVPTIG